LIIAIRLIGIFSILFGLWLVVSPRKAIDFQIAFYRRINWRMEPIDLKRELRSTRAMGFIAVVCGLAALLLIKWPV
jgi:uncharacterized membrane protein HdeD (DUF308 family)